MMNNGNVTFDFTFLRCPVQCRVFHTAIKAPLMFPTQQQQMKWEWGESQRLGGGLFFKYFLPPCKS